ncbi:hypothetical protein EVAR_90975_1 [Eumeta japonica]|uniref:Uncharacterized protein n=1 Tax=Eumeta variegata TaxID=151549 RepID=A0A4C1Z404_EUMVA|nr:hypothetical protein EVAR_90975_1 [Eumeta japonica]
MHGLSCTERTATRDASRSWAAGDVRGRVCYPPPSSITAPNAWCPLHLPVLRMRDDARALAGDSAAAPANETITKHPRTQMNPVLEEVKKKKKKMDPKYTKQAYRHNRKGRLTARDHINRTCLSAPAGHPNGRLSVNAVRVVHPTQMHSNRHL